MGTFRDSVALVWPLWLESRCPASNVRVVAGDLFATSNPLTSQTEKNLLSPFSNNPCHDAQVVHAFEPGNRRRPRFYEVALTLVFRARSCHATSQNPRYSRIDRDMIQDGKLRGFALGQVIAVRTDYTGGEVRRFAQRAKAVAQARRLLAIAALDGASREEAPRSVAWIVRRCGTG